MVSIQNDEPDEMALLGLKPPGPLNLEGIIAVNWRAWLHSYDRYTTAVGVTKDVLCQDG